MHESQDRRSAFAKFAAGASAAVGARHTQQSGAAASAARAHDVHAACPQGATSGSASGFKQTGHVRAAATAAGGAAMANG